MNRPADELRRVEIEIAEEKTAVLARIAGRLQSLIDEAAGLRTEVAAGRRRAIAAYEAVRQQARLYRWYLEVQREAVGLSRHDDLDRLYPVPPALADQDRAESGAAS
ncbi:MAG TPA: hypothetical protein VGL15_08715 [Vicinamibacteria bacterium]|jgi:hypothetical protein